MSLSVGREVDHVRTHAMPNNSQKGLTETADGRIVVICGQTTGRFKITNIIL